MNIMGTLWHILKKSTIDLWDEMLYLLLFNVVWLVGAILIIPMPFFTFALFFIARDVGQAKGIKFGMFINHGRKMWKPAYIWGGINFGLLVLVWLNLRFYAGIEAPWASFMQLVFIALSIFWLTTQLITLAFYPRIVEPSFKLALRNAAVIIGKNPIVIFVLMIFVCIILIISATFPAIGVLLAFSYIALLANTTVDILVKQSLSDRDSKQ